jgi:hypothetical protein
MYFSARVANRIYLVCPKRTTSHQVPTELFWHTETILPPYKLMVNCICLRCTGVRHFHNHYSRLQFKSKQCSCYLLRPPRLSALFHSRKQELKSVCSRPNLVPCFFLAKQPGKAGPPVVWPNQMVITRSFLTRRGLKADTAAPECTCLNLFPIFKSIHTSPKAQFYITYFFVCSNFNITKSYAISGDLKYMCISR